ncbi:hypothetical protein ACQ5SP_03685 [Rhodovulum sp. YNF3179]|uniref:hypothetical protein n=1 Tax=Rhodovulum sp. YNF3179 TaxID=3425127 RepID=UPI003D346C5A
MFERKDFFRYAIKCVAAFCLLGALLAAVRNFDVWAFVLAVPIITAPLVMVSSVFAAVRRGHTLSVFTSASFLRRLLSGTALRLVILSTFYGALTALVLIPVLSPVDPIEWLPFILGVPIFWVALKYSQANFGPHYVEPFKTIRPVSIAHWITTFTIVLLSVAMALTGYFTPEPLPAEQLSNIFEELEAPSALISELLAFARLLENFEAYIIGKASEAGENSRVLSILVFGTVSVGLAWTMSSFLALAAMPHSQLLRAIMPSDASPSPPKPTRSAIGWTVGIATFALAFVWAPLAANVDATLQMMPPEDRPVRRLARSTERIVVIVEEIRGIYTSPGTVSELRQTSLLKLADFEDVEKTKIKDAIDGAADVMIDNVDPFLDEYYSLVGEYRRIAAMMAGSLEKSLRRDLRQALERNAPTSELEKLISDARIDEKVPEITEEIVAEAEEIVESRRMNVPAGARVEVILSCSRLPCWEVESMTQDMMEDFADRLRITGTGAAAAGVVSAVIVKKLAAKGAIKMAAKALSKLASSKLAAGTLGTTLGGIAGGILGSVVPGAGTAAGAAGGAALGAVVVGLSVDKMMIELEEMVRREELRGQIVSAIDEWRDEMHETIDGRETGDIAVK